MHSHQIEPQARDRSRQFELIPPGEAGVRGWIGDAKLGPVETARNVNARSASRSRSWTPNHRPTPRISVASSGWGAPAAASWRRRVTHCPGTAPACTIFAAPVPPCRARRRRGRYRNSRSRDPAPCGGDRPRDRRSRNSASGCLSSSFTWVPVCLAPTRTARRRWWSGTARWCRCRNATTLPGKWW